MNAIPKQEIIEADARQHTPVASRSEADAYVALFERAAFDPAFDLGRLERMIQLRDKAVADEARREFNRAMTAVQKELPQVVRNAENTQTKSLYATIEAIGSAIDPIITAHGFSQIFASDDCPTAGCYRVVCTTAHDAGHERVDHLDVPIDIAGIAGTKNKTATHALASTITYGRRILTMLIFNVKSRKALPDDDGNKDGGPPIESEQFAKIKALLDSTGADKGRFLKFFGIEGLADLPAERFEEAITMLKRKGSQK